MVLPLRGRRPAGALGAAADAGAGADAAVADLRGWLAAEYAPAASRRRDPVGREAYTRWVRYWSGADLDLDEAYAWGWSEYARIHAEQRAEAEKVLPGATPRGRCAIWTSTARRVEGVDEVRDRLQGLMDEAIAALDGTHFDLAEPVRRVEAMIAPPGGARRRTTPAPRRTSPARAAPGCRRMGRTRFPLWDLVSTWYHEGVPGHHLQLAQWAYVAGAAVHVPDGVGPVSANAEGWALYAERLMDELGYLTRPRRAAGLPGRAADACRPRHHRHRHAPGAGDPGRRRARRPFRPGERWTPELAREFFGRSSGRPDRVPRQRARALPRLAGAGDRLQARRARMARGPGGRAAAHGASFDAKAWHMAALSQGSLGLDDLVAELAAL